MEKMEQFGLSFWIGLALAIPLSVVGNLLTPRFQQWVAKRDTVKAEQQISSLRTQLEELERITSEPGRLQTYLLESVLAITLLTSSFGAVSGLFFMMGALLPEAARLLLPIGQIFAVAGGTLVAKECISTLQKSRHARNIEKFKAEVSEKISGLK